MAAPAGAAAALRALARSHGLAAFQCLSGSASWHASGACCCCCRRCRPPLVSDTGGDAAADEAREPEGQQRADPPDVLRHASGSTNCGIALGRTPVRLASVMIGLTACGSTKLMQAADAGRVVRAACAVRRAAVVNARGAADAPKYAAWRPARVPPPYLRLPRPRAVGAAIRARRQRYGAAAGAAVARSWRIQAGDRRAPKRGAVRPAAAEPVAVLADPHRSRGAMGLLVPLRILGSRWTADTSERRNAMII